MQLREYLDNGGKGKLNIIAINWDEGRYGNPSPRRLQRFVRDFHPDIKIISMDDAVMKDFAPVSYVPASFIFDGTGKKVFGDGSREYLGKDRLSAFVDKLQ